MGIVNEILWGTVGQAPVQSFYYAAYEAIRKATYVLFIHIVSLDLLCVDYSIVVQSRLFFHRGIGSGAGPYIAIHEGFQGVGLSSENSISRYLSSENA